jgi:hypothetical protein
MVTVNDDPHARAKWHTDRDAGSNAYSYLDPDPNRY